MFTSNHIKQNCVCIISLLKEKAGPSPALPLNSTNSYGNMPVVIIIKHPNEYVYDMLVGDTRRLLIVPKNELHEAKMIMKLVHEHFGWGNQ